MPSVEWRQNGSGAIKISEDDSHKDWAASSEMETGCQLQELLWTLTWKHLETLRCEEQGKQNMVSRIYFLCVCDNIKSV